MSRSRGELPRFEVNESDEKRWRRWMGKGGHGPAVDAVVRVQREIEKLEDKRDALIQDLDNKAAESVEGSSWPVCRPSDINDGEWPGIAAEMPTNTFWRQVYARLAAYCERMKE